MAWYYTFEAKEIQRFIMQSDKLRDMVGGSELVNQLCDGFLKDALRAVGVREPEKAIIANAAGWARILFDDEATARQFQSAWPLLAGRFAPGLKVIQCLEKIDGSLPQAMAKSIKVLRAARNLNTADLPQVGPLIERYPRTGAPAVAWGKETHTTDQVPVDRQTLRKTEAAQNTSLIRKITEEFRESTWPMDMDEIASGDSAYIAVIHADGNDLGAMVMSIAKHLKSHPDEAAEIYQALSRVVEETTVCAVRKACEATLFADFRNGKRKKLPARPIVLGGDDLTMIVRADLALAFTEEFLREFEMGSKVILASRLGKYNIKTLPGSLTACAGIAFVKKAYPFSSAYHMAESLCEHTKRAAKADRDARILDGRKPVVPSSLTFYRISTSMAEGFGEAKTKELTGRSQTPLKFWYGPYAVGEERGGVPELEALRDLAGALSEIPTGSIRTLIDTLHGNPEDASAAYQRILQVADKAKGEKLQKSLFALTVNETSPLWNHQHQTPLLDAHLLRELTKGERDVQG